MASLGIVQGHLAVRTGAEARLHKTSKLLADLAGGHADGTSLIITAHRAPQDWHGLLPNPVVAESLLDRLINTSHQVVVNGPSYRPNKRPKAKTPTTT